MKTEYVMVKKDHLINMMSDKDHDTRINAERAMLQALSEAPSQEAEPVAETLPPLITESGARVQTIKLLCPDLPGGVKLYTAQPPAVASSICPVCGEGVLSLHISDNEGAPFFYHTCSVCGCEQASPDISRINKHVSQWLNKQPAVAVQPRAHFLPGAGRRSGSAAAGVVHYVLPVNGDNVNEALCGERPTGKSLGWAETSRPVTCAECIAVAAVQEQPAPVPTSERLPTKEDAGTSRYRVVCEIDGIRIRVGLVVRSTSGWKYYPDTCAHRPSAKYWPTPEAAIKGRVRKDAVLEADDGK